MFTGLKEQLDFSDSLITNILPPGHDLIKLKKVLNWKKINTIYRGCFKSKRGPSTKSTDLVIGLLILKHLYKKPDRILIEELEVNNAFMHFCSVTHEDLLAIREKGKGKKIISHTTLVKARKRLGVKRIKKIEKLFLNELIEKGIIDGRKIFFDTTSQEKNILFPTDISLLKRVIEQGEMIIQKVIRKNKLMKTKVIEEANKIAKIYYSANKKTKELLHSTSKRLIEIAAKILEKSKRTIDLLGNTYSQGFKKTLTKNFNKLQTVGLSIVKQIRERIDGIKNTDKIVSYFEEHCRALPKGKVNRVCEFGSKLELSMSQNGYITHHKLHQGNPGDVGMMEDIIMEHSLMFPGEFKVAAADRGFFDEKLINDLQYIHNIELVIPHKKDKSKKMTVAQKKIYNQRSAIEAKISEGKRTCGLNKSYFKGNDGDEIWETMGVLALNARKLLRDLVKRPKLLQTFG